MCDTFPRAPPLQSEQPYQHIGLLRLSKIVIENFQGMNTMREINLAIAILLIAAVCSTSAQKRDLQQTGTGSSLTGSQEGNRPPEALVFKPIPGDPKNRMAEFTTPKGVRMRAVTDGPDDIHFTPVDQRQTFMDIYLHCPRAVEKLSGDVGATIDLFGGIFGGGGTSRWVGMKLSNCKVTTTVVIDENGKTTTTIKTTCDAA